MSWVVPLVGCGGPAVSRCGHETRRHRVRGPLFASVFASVLLAACGGGAGNDSVSTNYKPEPGPPGVSPLAATGDGGNESEEPTQQQTIIEEESESEKIVVNIQPEPEESESEEQEEESEEEEEQQQQQLTIIEEEDFPYVPPEEEEPRYSAQTQTQTQGSGQGSGTSLARTGGLPEPQEIKNCNGCANATKRTNTIAGITYYLENHFNDLDNSVALKGKDRYIRASIIERGTNSMDNTFNPSHAGYNFAYKNIDRHKKIEVTYTKQDGFVGAYSYKGDSDFIEEDVTLKATFFDSLINPTAIIHGYIGDDNGIIIGTGMEKINFGQIRFSANDVSEDGQFIDSNQISFSNKSITVEKGFNELRGSFKNDGSTTSFPTQVVGELKMKRFYDPSPLRSNPKKYTNNLYSRGDNALAGVFVADKASEVKQIIAPIKIDAIEGTIGMFDYGLWASENFLDNKIEFLTRSTILNPETRSGNYVFHETQNLNVRYKREDGFKGVYIYEGETGELTGDVDLQLHFRTNPDKRIEVYGNILTDLQIDGNNLNGIAIKKGIITPSSGVGGVTGLNGSEFSFANRDFQTEAFNRPNMNYRGQGKIRMVLSPDGVPAQGSTPESYPSQIAGELEINGFKINADDGDNNTIVGVFVADKE